MTDKHTFSVEDRTLVGKKVKQLRREGVGVGSISTPSGSAKSIQFNQKQFSKMLADAGESSLLYLKVGEEKKQRPVLVEEIQVDPRSDEMIHVSFRQVSLKEKVSSEIPIEIIGEVDIPETTLVVVRDFVEVEALPTDLPEKFEVDVSVLTEAGQSISVADLKVDSSKITLVIGEDQEAEDMPIVLLQEVKEEVIEEPEETPEGEEGEAVESETEAESGESDSEEAKEAAE